MDKKEIIVIANQQQGLIQFNYEELKKSVIENMKPYRNVVLTEETLKEGIQTRAKLNNLVKQVDDKRKEIKKAYSEPLTVFENQVKDILSVVKEESVNFDVQIKEFEQKEKELKKGKIYDYYADKYENDYFQFEQFFEEQWLLKKFSEKDWKKAIDEKVERIEKEVKFINSLGLEDSDILVNFYLAEGFDLVHAQERYDELIKRLKQIKQNQNKDETVVADDKETFLYKRTFTVYNCTLEDLLAIEQVFKERNIDFKKGN